jgi:MFS family permease
MGEAQHRFGVKAPVRRAAGRKGRNSFMTSTTATTPAASSKKVTPYAWFVLAFLCVVYIFNFMDRQLMSVLTTDIKDDLHLTDSEIGLMTGLLFALFYTLLGVAAGWLADRSVRVRILAAGCFIWSLFTLLCGKATSFPIMAISRMGVGVGEAAGAPPSYSIVSDYFPAEKRGQALAIFSLGVPFGMALGTYVGPTIAKAFNDADGHGGWRMAFISIGVAGMIASILLLLVVREPKKGAMDDLDVHMAETPAIHSPRPFMTSLNEFFGRPMLLAAAISCAMAAFVGYATLNWTVPFMQREFGKAEWAGMNTNYALMLAFAMGLGTWLSGKVVDVLAKRSRINYALLPAAALALAIPGFIGFVWAPTMIGKLAFLAIPTFLTIFYLAPALAVVQNAVPATQRTISGAMLLLVLNLIGLGGGPTMVGVLSDHFNESNLQAASLTVEACKTATDAAKAACANASADGLQHALYFVVPFYVVAVLAHLFSAWCIKREMTNGRPSAETMARNAKIFKLVVGFGGIAVILIAEQLLFQQPLTRDIAAIQGLFSGAKLAPQITNGLVRDLLMVMMLVVGLFGVADLVSKPKASTAAA